MTDQAMPSRRPLPQAGPTVRITVPLFETHVLVNDRVAFGRIQVARNVVLADLTSNEGERIRKALDEQFAPSWRLEVHGFAVREDPRDRFYEDPSVVPTVHRMMALLALVVRKAPRWPTVVLDEHVGQQWVRRQWIASTGRSSVGRGSRWASIVPFERLATWGQLIEHWPDDDRLDLALDFYYNSIIDAREGDPRRAMLLAAVALEVLLAGDGGGELSHRLAQRGAILTGPRSAAPTTFTLLKKWYGERSKLVHSGKAPSPDTVAQVHQFLMRALPSMAALVKRTGSFYAATEVLDAGVWESTPDLEAVMADPAAWWAYTDLTPILIAQNQPHLSPDL